MKKHARSTSKGSSVLVSLLLLCVAVNFLVSWIAGSTLLNSDASPSSSVIHPSKPKPKFERQTMAPQNSSHNTAGFIHVGKTGGSTISKLLRNGCTSFVEGPCRTIENESIVSKMVEHYYHVPDFHRIPSSNHASFIISVRDVFERTVSSFLYHHPKNAAANNVTLLKSHEEYGPLAYSCFDTLDEFATLVGGIQDPGSCRYPYRHNVVDATDCPALACATLHGKVRFFVHLFFNFRNILYTKVPKEPPRRLYSLRQEYLWQDWKALNIMWGQVDPVYIPPSKFNQRNISAIPLPIGRNISRQGKFLLCTALKAEYVAYFRILRMSHNMNDEDFENSVKIAEKSCPNLDIREIVGSITTR